MSESVGGAEREVLARAAAEVGAHRRAYHRRLAGIAALDQLGTAARTGYRSTERLIADRDNLDTTDAKRLVAEARDLCARRSLAGEVLPALLPATGASSSAGLIDPAHIRIIRETMRHLAGLLTPPPLEELVRIEAVLAEHAQLLPPRMLRTLAQGFIALHDPDGAAPPDGQGARDELRFVRRKDGSLALKGRMHDPMDAEAFSNVIAALATPAGRGDERSLEKRQMDALNDLVQDARGPNGLATDTRRDRDRTETADGTDGRTGNGTDGRTEDGPAGDAEAGSADGSADNTGADDTGAREPWALIPEPRRPEPPSPRTGPAAKGWTERPGRALLTVTIDHRWLCAALTDRGGYGTLDSGRTVDAATLRRWACDAEIVPVVLGAKSEPLDVGRLQRTAPDAVRRALNIRDQGCAFPTCDRTPRRCHAHHVRQWLRDRGDTAVDNMVLLCRYHHDLIHHGHWTIEMIDGRPWFTPPWYIDNERTPRLGGRPRVPL